MSFVEVSGDSNRIINVNSVTLNASCRFKWIPTDLNVSLCDVVLGSGFFRTFTSFKSMSESVSVSVCGGEGVEGVCVGVC